MRHLQLHRVLRGQLADPNESQWRREAKLLEEWCTSSGTSTPQKALASSADENGQAEHHSAHWEQPHGTNHHQENPSSCHHAQRHGESLQKDFMQLNKTWPDAALINHWMSAPRGRTKPKKKMGFFDCLVGGYSFLLPSHYLWSNFSYNTSLSYILLSKHWEKMFFLFSCNNPDPSDKNIEAKQNSSQKRNSFWSPSKAQLFR